MDISRPLVGDPLCTGPSLREVIPPVSTTSRWGKRPRTSSFLIPLILLTLVKSPAVAAAQEVVPKPGDRVRVTVRVPFFAANGYRDKDLRYVGNLVEWDQVSMRWESAGSLRTATWGRVTKFEISQGRKSNWLKGGAIGAGIGLVSGLLWAAGEGALSDDEWSGLAVMGVGVVAGAGFTLGALIGAASPSDRWLAVDPQVYAGPERVVEAAGTAP